MPIRRLLLSTVSVLITAGPALAQTVQEPESERLPTVVVEGEDKASTIYHYGDPLDSGTSTFDADSVRDRSPGSGDVNQLLKALPTVQFSTSEGSATRQNIQDLRPEDISISGGRYYDNLFVVDGVGVNSRLDVTNNNPASYSDVAGASAQTLWIDSSLVGSVTVRDSNISAEFGKFTGGVVEIDTRSPRRAYGGEIYYGFTSTDLAKFRMSDISRDALGGAVVDPPDYDKRRYGLSLDLPINDRLRVLAGYNRSEAEVTWYRGNNYGNAPHVRRSLSENFLLKAEADLTGDLLLTGQISWSPYESESAAAAALNNVVETQGGGLTGRLALSGQRGQADWELSLAHAFSDSDRDGPLSNYSVTATGIVAGYFDGCTGSTCTQGFIGPLHQRQNDTTLKGVWRQPLWGGDFGAGFEVANVKAERNRPQTTYAYLTTSASPLTACADPNEGPSCVPGLYALTDRLEYRAFEAEAELQAYGLWAEHIFDWNDFRVRAGLRYDYETLFKNHDLAPRLSISRDLPWHGINLTLGLNRYYSRGFLGYAMQENYPGSRRYRRAFTLTGGQRVWSDNWNQTTHSEATQYSGLGLKTPYSDEVTLAVQGDLLGGRYRLRGVLRDNEDEISRTPLARVDYVNELTGATATRITYTPNNEGDSSYRGLSVEWNRDFGRHTFGVSTNISKTKTSNVDYFDQSDESLYDGQFVFYNGEIVPRLQALADNQRLDYAAPNIVNFDWGSRWWEGRISANVNARWRDSFTVINDTGVNTVVDGSSYDVYGPIHYKNSVDVNLAVSAELVRTAYGTALIDLRVNNLFNSVLNQNVSTTSEPWQMGRNLWVSVKYRY